MEMPECLPDIHEGPPNLAEWNVLSVTQLDAISWKIEHFKSTISRIHDF
jgi:hypothetical protein